MDEPAIKQGTIDEFGEFTLDPSERVLLDERRPFSSRTRWSTSFLLIRNKGRLLTEDEMMSSLREESFAEERNHAKGRLPPRRSLCHLQNADLRARATNRSQTLKTFPLKRGGNTEITVSDGMACPKINSEVSNRKRYTEMAHRLQKARDRWF